MATDNAQDSEEGGFLSRWSRRKEQARLGVAVAEPPAPPTVLQTVLPTVLPRAVAPPAGQATPAPGGPAAAVQPGVPGAAVVARAEPAPAGSVPPAALPPPPTLADVAALTGESDYARFVAPGVDRGVKNAALKKLFTNPHFNIMDGLDTYIDDYGRPDPLPEGMLRQMAQSHALGLFADEVPAPLPPSSAPSPSPSLAAPAAVPPTDAVAESPETLPPPKPQPDEDAALRLQPHDAAGPAGPGPGAEPHAGRQP